MARLLGRARPIAAARVKVARAATAVVSGSMGDGLRIDNGVSAVRFAFHQDVAGRAHAQARAITGPGQD